MVCRLLNRPDFQRLPDLPLPVYLRGVGHNIYPGYHRELLAPDNFAEVCWVDRGECEFEFQDRRVVVRAGESIYRLPYDLRRKRCLTAEGASHYWAAFDGPAAAWLIKSYGYEQQPMKSGPCPVHLFDEIEQGLLSMSAFRQRMMVGVLAEIIARMGGSDEEDDSRAGKVVREFARLVRKKYSDCDTNIDSIADELGVSRITLNRMMLKKTGSSPIDYLSRFRLQQAEALLKGSSLPIGEVARKVGVRRTNYFCRLIRAATGMTPQAYRRGEGAEKVPEA